MKIQDFQDNVTCGGFDNIFANIYKPQDIESQESRYMSAVEKFTALYPNRNDIHVYSAPGRTEIGGNHTDHQHGCVIAGAVDSCLENFLKSFKHLPGSPTNITEIKKTSEDDWLEWTLNMAFSSIENDIKNDIGICEYYRLVRNCIVHSGESSSTLKSKRALIKTTDNPRLNAPNGLDSLTFDDQVLFSRAAYNVAKYIFNNSQYDVNAIIEANREILNDLIMPFQEPGSRSRATKKVKYFIGLSYPELKDVNWESVVSTLLN